MSISLEEMIYAAITTETALRGTARGVPIATLARNIERRNTMPSAVARSGGVTTWVKQEAHALVQKGKLIDRNAGVPNVAMSLALSEETVKLLAGQSAIAGTSLKDVILTADRIGTADRKKRRGQRTAGTTVDRRNKARVSRDRQRKSDNGAEKTSLKKEVILTANAGKGTADRRNKARVSRDRQRKVDVDAKRKT